MARALRWPFEKNFISRVLGMTRPMRKLPRGLGMVRPRANKSGAIVFQARAKDYNNKPYFKTCKSERAAWKWLLEQDALRNQGKFLDGNKVTLEDFSKRYINSIAPVRKRKSVEGYKCDLKNHILPLFGKKKITEIRYKDGVSLQKTITNKGLSNKTNNKVLGLLKKILGVAATEKLGNQEIAKNPLSGFLFLPEEDKKIEFWKDEDVIYFLNNSKDNYYFDFYLAALNTGMRLSEIAALQVKKIDLDSRMITVSHSLERQKGIGKVLGLTKNRSSRPFPMNDTLVKIFKARVAGKEKDDYVFLNQKGGLVNIDHFCDRRFKTLQKRIGMEKIIRFHDLRHTYASNFMMKGGDLLTLKKLLGHKDISSTLVYAHFSPEYLKSGAGVLEYCCEETGKAA